MNLVRGYQAVHGVDLPNSLVQVFDDDVHPIIRLQERVYVGLKRRVTRRAKTIQSQTANLVQRHELVK